jgi:hypothetical protein
VAGRRPAFDPIGVTQQTYEDYTNPDMKKGQATKNLVGNVANQLPFASTFTGGRLPISSALPDVAGLVQGTTTPIKEATKMSQFVLPTGGGQIRKTVEGIQSFNKGGSFTPSGNLRFPIPQNPVNAVKSAVFGQYATPEANKYFRNGDTPKSEKQTAIFNDASFGKKVDTFKALMSISEIDKAKKTMKEGGDVSKLKPRSIAEAAISLIDAKDKKEQRAEFERLYKEGKITPEIAKEMGAIRQLAKKGLTSEDRQILLLPEEVRARKIIERIDALDKKNQRAKFEELYRNGVITPAVAAAMGKIRKSAKN